MLRAFIDFRFDEGGAGRYGRDLIEALDRISDPIEIAVNRQGTGTSSLLNKRFSPWARAIAAERARSWKADVFHGLHFELARASMPKAVTIQDMRPFVHPDSMSRGRRSIFTALVRDALRRADRIIVTSPMTVESVLANGGSKDRLRVIPLGISERWRPVPERQRSAARDRWADGHPYVGAIFHHHFRPHKNFHGFKRMAEILQSKTDARLLCVGAGQVRSTNLSFIGEISDMELRQFYSGAEVLVLPSIVEGFGYPILEALACGTPAVCGPAVGAAALVRDGILVVDVEDPERLAEGVLRLLEDSELRERLVRVGTDLVGPLTVEAMAEATAAVYRELATRQKAS